MRKVGGGEFGELGFLADGRWERCAPILTTFFSLSQCQTRHVRCGVRNVYMSSNENFFCREGGRAYVSIDYFIIYKKERKN